MDVNVSELKPYSLAIVTRDKAQDDVYIEAQPIERTSDYTGDIDKSIDEKVTVSNANGVITNTIISKTVKIRAKWLAMGASNRITPPNVKKGETVLIYRYSNTDRYYWVTIYNELDLRTTERIVYMISNKSKPGKANLKQAYYFIADSINKFIKFFTNADNGEHTTYDLEIDTKKGMLIFTDGKGNYYQLDSDKQNSTRNINNNDTLTVGHDQLLTITNNQTNNVGVNRTTEIGTDDKLTIGGNQTVNITGNQTTNIGGNQAIVLKKLSISNDTAEVMQTISDFIQAMIDAQHIGNLGVPTVHHPSTIAALQALKDKIDSFI